MKQGTDYVTGSQLKCVCKTAAFAGAEVSMAEHQEEEVDVSRECRDKLEQGWSGSRFSLQVSGSDDACVWQEKPRPKAAPDLGVGEAEGAWLFQVLHASEVSRRVTTDLSVVAWKPNANL